MISKYYSIQLQIYETCCTSTVLDMRIRLTHRGNSTEKKPVSQEM